MNEPLEEPVNRIVKRTMDMLISLPIIMFVLPPLCIVVKIFQAIQSPGPMFYRQTRAGLNNLPFRIFNFRTVRVGSLKDALNETSSSDAGSYAMGSLLRRTSLDRIPQLLNVFLGHMSIVGPCPRRPIHNRRFSEIAEGYHCRAFAKPGITGLAQISGFHGEAKNDEDVVESAKLDIRYIESWSLSLDFWIILNTVYQVFRPPKTAY
jgi:lipopolysaccharide/colanic/teichoic acid biosynthesis glycosyltransferase